MTDVWDGIIIGAAGGAIASLTVMIIKGAQNLYLEWENKKRIFIWLKNNTSDVAGNQFRSTKAIASWNNLTQERVRYICSIHEDIYLSVGKEEDMWGIYDREAVSAYETRGIVEI